MIRKNEKLYRLAIKVRVAIRTISSFYYIPRYISDYVHFRAKMRNGVEYKINRIFINPMLKDRKEYAGSAGLYMIQDLWAAEKIIGLGNVDVHYDIGSRLDGFITHLLACSKKVCMLDIRPLPYHVHENLAFLHTDATLLSEFADNSISTLSALCSLEHFGLGRYGDPIDPNACFKAFKAIERVIAVGGRVYLSLPVGEERIEFNAHRIFSPETIINLFPRLELVECKIATLEPHKPLISVSEYNNYSDSIKRRKDFFGLFEFIKHK